MSESADLKDGGAAASEAVFLGLPGVYVAVGDHIAHFFRGEQERLTILGPSIKAGLEAGDQCVVITEASAVSDIEAGLRELGVEVELALTSGQLLIANGCSDAQEMTEMFDSFISHAKDAERDVIRIGGDMTWALDKMPAPEKLLEWEALYDKYVGMRTSFVALCQYDRTRFGGNAIMYALETHPLSIIGHIVQVNPFYQDPDEILQGLA